MTQSSARRPLAIPLLYALFLLSGAAGLFYESVWSRYLGLFVGHSAYAQVVVLAIFLGGMSLGAALVSRRAERIARPLFWYAIIEIAVGVIGLYFHDIYVGATDFAYASLLPALSSGALRTTAVWALAALLILPQSILLGTTFPLMSAAVLRLAPNEPGRVLGWLYFTMHSRLYSERPRPKNAASAKETSLEKERFKLELKPCRSLRHIL